MSRAWRIEFKGEKDRHKSYREKIQKYAQEEVRLFEDLRHGLVLGSKQFVEKIRKKYLPTRLKPAEPQHKLLSTDVDLESFLAKAERKLNCDVKEFVKADRLSGTDKDKRDLLRYAIWRTAGRMGNAQIGKLFGLSCSAISHSVQRKAGQSQIQ